MNPSRLETTCKVTLDPVAFPSPDIIPPASADIDLHVRANQNAVGLVALRPATLTL
jgi:hypothetical protein